MLFVTKGAFILLNVFALYSSAISEAASNATTPVPGTGSEDTDKAIAILNTLVDQIIGSNLLKISFGLAAVIMLEFVLISLLSCCYCHKKGRLSALKAGGGTAAGAIDSAASAVGGVDEDFETTPHPAK